MMAGPPVYPNYNATTHILLSPVLYDPATVIGLSGVILAGSVGDINGVPVGTAAIMSVSPSWCYSPPVWSQSARERSIRWSIR